MNWRALLLICLIALPFSCRNTTQDFIKIADRVDRTALDRLVWSSPSTMDTPEHLMDSLNQQLVLLNQKGVEHPRYFEITNRVVDYKQQIQNYRNDASLYNLGGEVKAILAKVIEPSNRRDTIAQVLSNAQSYYQFAQAKIQAPSTSKLKLSIRKQIAGLEFLNQDFKKEIALENLSEANQEAWLKKIQNASLAIKDYVAWCNSQIVESSTIE